MNIYATENSVTKSFDENFIPEEQLQAQWAEFIELKKVITEQFHRQHKKISILDIGIGTARIPKHLCGIPEIWNMIDSYDGIDNAEPCINISKNTIASLDIGNKVSVYFLDAPSILQLGKKYDLIITTWFTAGNFYPEDFDFESYKESGIKLDLSSNKRFGKVFSAAYQMLLPGGQIVLGSIYKENDNTRKKQESFYQKIGMSIITGDHDSFTATREKFWSQRFTKEKIINYFSFAPNAGFDFTDLDNYDYAMQARIRK